MSLIAGHEKLASLRGFIKGIRNSMTHTHLSTGSELINCLQKLHIQMSHFIET